MDLRHVARLSKARRDLAERSSECDSRSLRDPRGAEELAEALRPTLRDALDSLRLLYEDDDVWEAAAETVAASNMTELKLVRNYPASLPALLELFGYLAPPPARQLVKDAVTSFQAVPEGESPTAMVATARDALGQLLEKTRDLEDARPWLLPAIASETTGALDMGVTLATGAATGGIMVAVGAAMVPAIVAGGGLAVAPMLILGGIHRWRRKRRMRARDERLLELQDQLSLDLVPAAQGAVVQHLNAIVSLARDTTAENPQALLDLSDHLQALIDITRRFGVSNSHLRAAAHQRALRGEDACAHDVLMQIPNVFAAALEAKRDLDAGGQISEEIRGDLERLRQVVENLGPRFGRRPPEIRPKP